MTTDSVGGGRLPPFRCELMQRDFFELPSWITLRDQFLAWTQEASNGGVFHIKAPRGAGKTIFLRYLTEYKSTESIEWIAMNLQNHSVSPAAIRAHLVAHFYAGGLSQQEVLVRSFKFLKKHRRRLVVILDNALADAADCVVSELKDFDLEYKILTCQADENGTSLNRWNALDLGAYLHTRSQQTGFDEKLFSTELQSDIVRLSQGLPGKMMIMCEEILKKGPDTKRPNSEVALPAPSHKSSSIDKIKELLNPKKTGS